MFLVAFVYLLNALASENMIESGYLIFHAIFVPYLSFFVIKSTVNTRKKYRLICGSMILSASILSLIAVYIFLISGSRVSLFGLPFIGAAVLFFVPVLLMLFDTEWKIGPRVIIGLIAVFALVVTIPRALLIYLVLSPVVFKLVRSGKSKQIYLLFMASTGIITIAYVSNLGSFLTSDEFVPEQFSTFFRLTNIEYWIYSLNERAVDFEAAFNSFLKNPIFGVGLQKGVFTVTHHNIHIAWLEYSGLVGYLFYSLVFYAHFRKMAKIAKNDRTIAANITILFGFLVNSLANGFLHGIIPLVFFIIMAFSEARYEIIKKTLCVRTPLVSGMSNRELWAGSST